jgi:hypothetical protein
MISLGEKTLAHLCRRAAAEDVSLESIIKTVLEDDAQTPALFGTQTALELALERAAAKNQGEEFSLEDLFSEDEWPRIPSPRAFGKRFRTLVESRDPKLARHVRKTVTNKAVYQRC